MKSKLIALLLIAVVLGTAAFALQGTHAQTTDVTDPAVPKPTSYLVTTPVCVQYGTSQAQRVYVNADITVGPLDTNKYRLILSSAPDSNTPFVVDDAVFVNGQKFGGYEGADNPQDHIAESASVCYQGTPALDVTGCLRHDGHVFVQCMDFGGVYACSALYLRVVPR